MLVKVKKLSETFKMPEKADPESAGYDLHSLEDCVLTHGVTHLFKMGFALEIPAGFEAQVRSRSGMALNHQVVVLNSPGTIDSSYRGEVGVILHNFGKEPYYVNKGDRIAQMIFCETPKVLFQEVCTLTDSERKDGGFGSTGR